MDIEVKQIRELWTPETKLFNTLYDNDFRAFFKDIEPRIVRGPFLPCWIWTGRMQIFHKDTAYERRYPTVHVTLDYGHKIERKQVYVHRFVAQLFWKYPERLAVFRTCREEACVNPNHFVITHKNNIEYT